jgi:hypothetical protein
MEPHRVPRPPPEQVPDGERDHDPGRQERAPIAAPDDNCDHGEDQDGEAADEPALERPGERTGRRQRGTEAVIDPGGAAPEARAPSESERVERCADRERHLQRPPGDPPVVQEDQHQERRRSRRNLRQA